MFIQAFNLHSWHGADTLNKCKYFINSYKLTSLFLHIYKDLNKVNIFYALGMNAIAYVGDVVFMCQACDRDVQCGVGLCCAVSLWLRGLRMCTPQGLEGDECHPYSHKVYTVMRNPSGIWKQWFDQLTWGNPGPTVIRTERKPGDKQRKDKKKRKTILS